MGDGAGRAVGSVTRWFGERTVLWIVRGASPGHRPQRSWFARYRWFLLNPAHIATIGFSVLLAIFLPSVLETPLASSGGNVAWGLLGVFVFGIVWTIAVTWWMSRPDRFRTAERDSSACAISEDVAQFFEGRRHVYGFRNQPFADAFQRSNQARIWERGRSGPHVEEVARRHDPLIVVVGGARLLLWYTQGR